jgi:hypothetical protein
MKNTADFLDELRIKLDLPSDGKLADYLGMHRQHISRYRTLDGTFDDEKSIQIAELLGTDAAFVVACMHHQRAKKPAEKQLWERMAMNIGAAGAVAACALIVLALPYAGAQSGLEYSGLIGSIAAAESLKNQGGKMYIM